MLAKVNNRVNETIAQSWIVLTRVYCTYLMRERVRREGVSSEQIHHNHRYGNRDTLIRIKENRRRIVDIGRIAASSLARLV
jgi:predicted chitinase